MIGHRNGYLFRPKVEGYYRIEAVDIFTNKRRVAADWFPNVITNTGLDAMGTSSVTAYCMVGSGNDVPTIYDTALKFRIASTNTVTSNVAAARSVPPYYGTATKTFRFAAGAAAGNLSEVGVGWNGVNCFSRSLILDSLGAPTSITILPNEFLDVIYELRLYPPTEDDFFNINLAGSTYLVTVRASSVTDPYAWAPLSPGPVNFYSSSQTTQAYSGNIGAVTGTPTGSSYSVYPSNNEYQIGSLTKTAYSLFPLDGANFGAGGIRSLRTYTQYCVGAYQFQFDPPVPKDNTKTWRVDYGVTWARNE